MFIALGVVLLHCQLVGGTLLDLLKGLFLELFVLSKETPYAVGNIVSACLISCFNSLGLGSFVPLVVDTFHLQPLLNTLSLWVGVISSETAAPTDCCKNL